MSIPEKIEKVSVVCRANVYFDGKVASHTVLFGDGTKKTVGLIYPGSFTFNTGVPEKMEIVSGSCRVRLKGETAWKSYGAGTEFSVPGNSAFDIAVEKGIAEYICSYG